MRKIISLCLLLIAGFASPQANAQVPQYNFFYVFGDSLSDTGNDLILTRALGIDPPIPPSETPHRTYYNGRFSNGRVAMEYLWRGLSGSNVSLSPFLSDTKLPSHGGGVSFAFGGSTSGYLSQMPGGPFVPGTLGQIELFRKALKGNRSRNALYAVWSGANDYLLEETDKPDEVVANITQAIRTLHAVGARDFLVPNLPNLGLTPLIKAKGLEAETKFLLLTQSHNALLAQALKELRLRLPGIKIFLVDLFTVTQNLLNESKVIPVPSVLDYFFPGSGASSCFFVNRTICPDVDLTMKPPPFAFWDVLHPTTFVHELYGQAMLKSLQTLDTAIQY